MPSQLDDMVAVRREILGLLHQQMAVLNSAPELTDDQLIECYNRQGLLQQLRDKLQALLNFEQQSRDEAIHSELVEVAPSTVLTPISFAASIQESVALS
jgi:hypothetical protein